MAQVVSSYALQDKISIHTITNVNALQEQIGLDLFVLAVLLEEFTTQLTKFVNAHLIQDGMVIVALQFKIVLVEDSGMFTLLPVSVQQELHGMELHALESKFAQEDHISISSLMNVSAHPIHKLLMVFVNQLDVMVVKHGMEFPVNVIQDTIGMELIV